MRKLGSRVGLAALALAAAAALGLPGVARAATESPGATTHAKTTSGTALGPVRVTRSTAVVTEQGRAAASAVSDLPLPPLCKQAKKSDRTAQCRVGAGKIVLLSGADVVVGTGSFDFANWEFLDAKSRTWHNTVEMEVTSFTGVAVFDDLVFEFGLKCSTGCNVAAPNPAPRHRLLRGVVFQHMFTVDSPGSATVDGIQVPELLVVDLSRISVPFRGQANPITARCDSDRFPTNPPPGCVNASFTPTFTIGTGTGVDDIVAHIARAQTHLKHHWGRKGSGPPLHRTTDAVLIDRNRAVACGNRGKPPKPDQNCDEYPFASTEEGAANNPDYSWAWVNATQNFRAGGLLGAFYVKNRVIDHDAFWVSVR